jgi:hypothetical protein
VINVQPTREKHGHGSLVSRSAAGSCERHAIPSADEKEINAIRYALGIACLSQDPGAPYAIPLDPPTYHTSQTISIRGRLMVSQSPWAQFVLLGVLKKITALLCGGKGKMLWCTECANEEYLAHNCAQRPMAGGAPKKEQQTIKKTNGERRRACKRVK